MTIGQRISTKRKENNLSQEALGEALGVSRQAIYKWESDQALPEIEKLVALSRLFGVSVGWLLGVEEETSSEQGTDATSFDNGFSEKQLMMIEELLKRYSQHQATQSETISAPRKKRRRWLYVLAVLLVLFLFLRIEQLKSQYDALENNLQNSINRVTSNLNSQLGSLTYQVESILKAQNSLTADYRAEYVSMDPTANTATFQVSAVPKTYVEGMSATFLANSDGRITELSGTFSPANQAFSGELTCELTDDITLSVVFQHGDTKATQVLNQFTYLYSGSFPEVFISGAPLWGTPVTKDDIANMYQDVVWVNVSPDVKSPLDIQIKTIEVGLFRDRSLITWGIPCEKPETFQGGKGDEQFFSFPAMSFPVNKGELYSLSARITDNYGRDYMITESCFEYNPLVDASRLDWSDQSVGYFSDTDGWEF